MDADTYRQFVIQLDRLEEGQVADVAEKLRLKRNSSSVKRLVAERMADERCCPFCNGRKVSKHGSANGNPRFLCGSCRKTFSALTGTPFHRVRDKEKLLENAACMADGLSLEKTADRLGISKTRAFRWRHKFLSFLNRQKPQCLSGVVEADETLFPLSFKGKRSGMPRESKRHGGPTKSGQGKEKVVVLVAVQRGTRKVYDEVLLDGSKESLKLAMQPALAADAVLVTDGNVSYESVAADLAVKHEHFVSARVGKGGEGAIHVQSVNRYDSTLKSWMVRFHGVASKYLANYLGWRRLLDRFEDALTPQQFMFHALRVQYLTPGTNT